MACCAEVSADDPSGAASVIEDARATTDAKSKAFSVSFMSCPFLPGFAWSMLKVSSSNVR